MTANKAPLFSIVIPTRNRAHLLPYALRSALNQQFDDYEIVVCANYCEDNTREVVQALKHPRIHYFETDKVLTMPENWEFAWSKATGEYVIFLSDDDALTPSALSMLAEKTLQDKPPVISWEDAVYYYNDWNDAKLQNTLLLFHFGDTLVEDVPAETYRKQLASFNFAWNSPLPKSLNCAARRDFFNTWRERLGKLFFPIAPDYSFAWISLHVCKTIRVLHWPLSIRGISDHSIGSNAGLGEASKIFFQEFGKFDFFQETGLQLPLAFNHLAATYLRVNPHLKAWDIEPEVLDQDAFQLALAKQLQECQALLPNWAENKATLLAYVQEHAPHLHKQMTELFSQAPKLAPENTESMRDMQARIAKMAREYRKHLDNAIKQHAGDEDCAACVLALRNEILVEPEWSYLYLFGERVNALDPYSISTKTDYYYQLLTACKKKKKVNA